MNASNLYKAEKGLIRVSAQIENGTIMSIQITGDFFLLPESSLPGLEKRLVGEKLEEKSLLEVIGAFYSTGVVTPLLEKEDFVRAILGVKDGIQTA